MTKKATQADVTYTVTVKNTSGFAVNITDLNDTVYDDITQKAPTNPKILDTDCSVPQNNLANDATYSCKFVVRHVDNDPHAADDVSNQVDVELTDPITSNKVTRSGGTRVIIELNAAPATP